MGRQGVIGREWIVKKTLFVLAIMGILGIVLIIVAVTKESMPALTKVGPFNLFSTEWNPKVGKYGIVVFIVGTLLTTVGGVMVAVPLAIGTALFLTEIAPRRMATLVSRGVELLAGMPSIVIGWMGFTILVPLLAKLTRTTGSGILAASIILGIMSMPIITSIARDALETVPSSYKQASIGLGATRWQTIWHVILPAAKPGLLVAVILGIGRAIGETVAVALVIGPASAFPKSLTTPTHTLTTKILMEMGESSGIQRSVLFAMALVLLLLSMALILTVRLVTRKKAYVR
ncbi:MAG: phosphate ABC transporter permease subunit PstC [Actinomycetota bacterium]|nr:phosphate ABC transporter permease subunit PstC [Actinomycetota bacterium]